MLSAVRLCAPVAMGAFVDTKGTPQFSVIYDDESAHFAMMDTTLAGNSIHDVVTAGFDFWGQIRRLKDLTKAVARSLRVG